MACPWTTFWVVIAFQHNARGVVGQGQLFVTATLSAAKWLDKSGDYFLFFTREAVFGLLFCQMLFEGCVGDGKFKDRPQKVFAFEGHTGIWQTIVGDFPSTM